MNKKSPKKTSIPLCDAGENKNWKFTLSIASVPALIAAAGICVNSCINQSRENARNQLNQSIQLLSKLHSEFPDQDYRIVNCLDQFKQSSRELGELIDVTGNKMPAGALSEKVSRIRSSAALLRRELLGMQLLLSISGLPATENVKIMGIALEQLNETRDEVLNSIISRGRAPAADKIDDLLQSLNVTIADSLINTRKRVANLAELKAAKLLGSEP